MRRQCPTHHSTGPAQKAAQAAHLHVRPHNSMRHPLRTLALGIMLYCAALAGYCASFDCSSKLSGVEDIICSDDGLSALDDILSTTYRLALDISDDKKASKAEQNRWLSGVRNRCKDDNCLSQVYGDRISELESRWEQRTRAINLHRAREESLTANPFEGTWQSCQLWKGEQICSTSSFVQVGNKVCGEVEDWASGHYYTTRIQATAKNSNQAQVTSQCGMPATNDVPIECDFDDRDPTRWQKTTGSGFSICMGQLLSLNTPCNSNPKTQGQIHRSLSEAARKEMLNQAWVQRCLKLH